MSNPLSRRLARIEATNTPADGPKSVRLVPIEGETPEEVDAACAAHEVGADEMVIFLRPLFPAETAQ